MAAVSVDQFPRKTSLRNAKKLPSKADLELVNLKGNSGEIFIAIAESTAPTHAENATPSRARVAGSSRPSSPLARMPLQNRAPSLSETINPPRSHTSSPTLVRSGSTGSTATHSPVMRSMFSRFDPSVSLAQQKYYPNMERMPRVPTWTHDTFTRPEYSPSLYSQPVSPSLSAKDRLKQKKSGFIFGDVSASVTQQSGGPPRSMECSQWPKWPISPRRIYSGSPLVSSPFLSTFYPRNSLLIFCSPSSTTIHLTSSTSSMYTLSSSPSSK